MKIHRRALLAIELVAITILYIPLITYSQNDSSFEGINWATRLTWEQIKEKAKKENKYIFVDCYATWCRPCKRMDEEVYRLKAVGDKYNSKFVSVKIQMDKTNADDETAKKWHQDAVTIQSFYSINSFPTYLFFAPDGHIVHKAVGFMTEADFIKLGDDAINSPNRYYQVLENFKPGKIDTSELKGLAFSFLYTDKDLAGKIAADYLDRVADSDWIRDDNLKFINQFKYNDQIRDMVLSHLKQTTHSQKTISKTQYTLLTFFKEDTAFQKIVINYLGSLNEEQLFIKNNLLLISEFSMLLNPGDRYFRFLSAHSKKINNITQKQEYAEQVISRIVIVKKIMPLFDKADSVNNDVDWTKIFMIIKDAVSSNYAIRKLMDLKVEWYRHKTKQAEKAHFNEKKWGEKFAFSLTEKLDKYGLDTSGWTGIITGNDLEYSIYRYCNDTITVRKAINWLGKIMISNPGIGYSYVYAGLLYKAGKVNEAMQWQQMTIRIKEGNAYATHANLKDDKWYLRQLEILEQMKKREPFEKIIFWEF